jgi:hypothetical protein
MGTSRRPLSGVLCLLRHRRANTAGGDNTAFIDYVVLSGNTVQHSSGGSVVPAATTGALSATLTGLTESFFKSSGDTLSLDPTSTPLLTRSVGGLSFTQASLQSATVLSQLDQKFQVRWKGDLNIPQTSSSLYGFKMPNAEGAILTIDNVKWLYQPSAPGDLNLNGAVDFTDFQALSTNYNTLGGGWANGDFNGDGAVNFADFQALTNKYLAPIVPGVIDNSNITPDSRHLTLTPGQHQIQVDYFQHNNSSNPDTGELSEAHLLVSNTPTDPSTYHDISSVAPIVTVSPFQATTGEEFSGEIATFTAAAFGTNPSDYSVSDVLWSDGSSAADAVEVYDNGDGTFSIYDTHTFSRAGRFAAPVTVTYRPSSVFSTPVDALASVPDRLLIPTVATAAAAGQSVVTGSTDTLSVLGGLAGGYESDLIYEWSVTSGPKATFTQNYTNAAKSTTVIFSAAGAYVLKVTISNGTNTVTSDVSVTVKQVQTSLAMSPSTADVASGGTWQFTAAAYDQFGGLMNPAPTFDWSVISGGGSVDMNGLYTAPSATGSATVQVTAGGVSRQSQVTVSQGSSYQVTLTGRSYEAGYSAANTTGDLTVTHSGWITAISPENAVQQAISGTVTLNDTLTFPTDLGKDIGFALLGSASELADHRFTWDAANSRYTGTIGMSHAPTDYDLYWNVTVEILPPPKLDIDSNNDSGLALPNSGPAELAIKDDSTKPGKIVAVNDGDADHDGIIDWADGYKLNQSISDMAQTPGEHFTPLVLTVPSSIDLAAASFRFQYDGSDPLAVTTTGSGIAGDPTILKLPAQGTLRLWKKDGDQTRSGNSVGSGGEWIKPGEDMTAAQLGLTDSSRTVTFYVETVKPSQALADQRVTVALSESGGPGVQDSVRITSIAPKLQWVTHDAQTGQEYPVDTLDPSDPRPEVTLSITSTHIDQDGYVVVNVSGTVHDALSEVLNDASAQLQKLYFSVNGVQFDELDNLASQSSGGTVDAWTPHPFNVNFQRTLRIPATAGNSLIIRAETSQNAAGNTGWADVGVGVSWVPESQFTPGSGSNLTGGGSVTVGESSEQNQYYPIITHQETLSVSEPGTFEPAMIRVTGLPAELADRFVFSLNGQQQDIAPFDPPSGVAPPAAGALHDDKNYYVVYGNDHTHRRILVATMEQVPPDLSIVQPDNIGGGYGKADFTLRVKTETGTFIASKVLVMPQSFGPGSAPKSTPTWTMDQMLTWFETMYGQDGLRILQYYQLGQNLITPTHFTSNKTLLNWAIGGKTWDMNWFTRTDNRVEIQIEQNLTSIAAAQALYEGLQRAIGKPVFRSQILQQIQNDPANPDIENLLASYAQTGLDALAIGNAAAETYVAGIQIASAPASIFVAFNDLVDGHYGQAALNAMPLLAPALLKLGKTAFKVTLKSGKSFSIGAGVAKALGELEQLPTLEARIAHLEQAALAGGEALTPEARLALAKSKYIQSVLPKGSTSALLAKNLEASGKLKPALLKNAQAHHDLPQKFRDVFTGHGLDIDKADYGRWVEGTPPGLHQKWTSQFNSEWQKFWDAEAAVTNGGSYTKQQVLDKMNSLKNDSRFQ